MSKYAIEDSTLVAIGDAIRDKNGTTDTYTPAEMATAIGAIETGITPTGELEITENGTYDVTDYASAIVNVLSGGNYEDGNEVSF